MSAETHYVIRTDPSFWLSRGDPAELPVRDTPRDSLITVWGPASLAVSTGIHLGVVKVSVEVLEEPIWSAEDDWEEISQASIAAGSTGLSLVSGDFLEGHPLTDEPSELLIRVHARGRTRNPDGVDSEPFEQYLVQLCSAPHASLTTIKQLG